MNLHNFEMNGKQKSQNRQATNKSVNTQSHNSFDRGYMHC